MKTWLRKQVMTITVFLLACPTLEARPRSLYINYGNRHLVGNTEIPISHDAHDLFTGIEFETARPVLVTLRIKDRLGNGEASFVVGGMRSFPQNIPGTPQLFVTDANETFSTVALRNPSRDMFLPWIIALQGDIILQNAVLVIDDNVDPEEETLYDLVPVTGTATTTRVQLGQALAALIIQLPADTPSASVESALVHLPTGAAQRLNDLEGSLPQPGHGGTRLVHDFRTHGGATRIQDLIIRASGRRTSSSIPAFIEVRAVPAPTP